LLSSKDELGVTVEGMDDFEEAKQMISDEEVTSRFKKISVGTRPQQKVTLSLWFLRNQRTTRKKT
jgi:hypothetical protein